MATRVVDVKIRTTVDGKGIDKLLASLRGVGTAGKGAAAGAGSIGQLGTAATKAQKQVLALAQAQARLQQQQASAATAAQRLATAQQQTANAQQQGAVAAQRLATEAQRTAAAQARAEQAALRLATAQQRAAQGSGQLASGMQVLPRTIAGLSHEAANFARVAASAFAVGQIAEFGKAAITAANNLEDAKTSLRTISGDTATYNQTLEVAAQNQRLFGGSLASNIEDMSGFVISARLAGVELEQLLDLSQRLATLDPGQGARGASIALRELLSGNERSLAMRFELPKAALKAMGDESLSASEKLAELSKFLDSVGVSSEAIRSKLDNNSQSFRDLAVAGEGAFTRLGEAAAKWSAPVADFLTMVLNAINEASDRGNPLEGVEQAFAAIAEHAKNYGPEVSGEVEKIRESFMEIGEAGPAAVAGLEVLGEHFRQQRISSDDLIGSIAMLREHQAELGHITEDGAGKVAELVAQLAHGEIGVDQFSVEIANLANQHAAATAEAIRNEGAVTRAGAATDTHTAAAASLADQLMAAAAAIEGESLAAQAQKAALEAAAQAAFAEENANKGVEDQARAAADALFGSGAAGIAAANDFIASIPGIDATAAAYIRLRAAMLAVNTKEITDPRRRGQEGGLLGGGQSNNDVGRGQGSRGPLTPPPLPPLKFADPPKPKGGGGGGSSARVSEEQKTQEQLAKIATDGARRIEEINASTAEKLVEIDRKAAERRAAIARDLAEDMASSAADMAFEAEANDFDLIGKLDKKQKAELEARERAEDEALARQKEINERTKQLVEEGAVEQAEAYYNVQSEANKKRQELDEAYYKKQVELAGNKDALAALEQQYQEAVAALDEATNVQQGIADAKAEDAVKAVEDEKAGVIAEAELQKQEVIKKAEEQAAGVAKASDTQREAVVTALRDQAQAATDWATAVETAAGKAIEAAGKASDALAGMSAPASGSDSGSGAGGGTAAAGGGTFMTRGPTTLTVGDNPGGMELVSVVPLSGRGSTRVGPGMVRMGAGGAGIAGFGGAVGGGGGEVDTSILEAANKLIERVAALGEQAAIHAEHLKNYATAASAAVEILEAARALAKASAEVVEPIDAAHVEQLADQARQAATIVRSRLVPISEEEAESFARYGDAVADSLDVLAAVHDLARAVEAPQPPLNPIYLEELAAAGRDVLELIGRQMLPVAEEAGELLQRYMEAVDGSIQVLSALDDLARATAAPAPPLNAAYLDDLARESQRVGAIVGHYLLRPAEEDLETLRRYLEAVTGSVELLSGMHGLRRDLRSPQPPIDEAYAIELAEEARAVALILGRNLHNFTANMTEAIQEYVANSSNAIQLLRDAAGLRKDLADVGPPIDLALAQQLAAEARDVALIISRNLFNFTANISEAIARYAETSANTVSVLQGVAGLRAALKDTEGPISEADILRLAQEARAVVIAVGRTLIPTTEEAATELARYSDTASSAIAALGAAAGLRATAAELAAPLDPAVLRGLADDARRATEVIRDTLVPTTEEQATAAQRWADLVSSSTSALSSVAGLGADMFTDYRSPTDAQLNLLASDARRIADAFGRAAQTMSAEGSEQAQAYADALGSTFTAAREGLLLIDAINARGDWKLDATKLGQFEESAAQLLGTTGRLGALAATIPAGDIGALGGAADAATRVAESLVALSAVPFDNLQALTGSFAAGAGGSSSVTNTYNISIVQQPGQDARALADMVVRQINSQVGARR